MHAQVGERLLIHGRKVGHPEQHAEVLEVRGADGAPPYLVRFEDGHEGLVFPGSDCHVDARAGVVRPGGSAPGARARRR